MANDAGEAQIAPAEPVQDTPLNWLGMLLVLLTVCVTFGITISFGLSFPNTIQAVPKIVLVVPVVLLGFGFWIAMFKICELLRIPITKKPTTCPGCHNPLASYDDKSCARYGADWSLKDGNRTDLEILNTSSSTNIALDKLNVEESCVFEIGFAHTNNWGRAVGFSGDDALVLEKDHETDTFELRPVHCREVLGIRAREYRSIYGIVLGSGSAIVALFLVVVGIAAQQFAPVLITISVGLAVFSYFVFSNTKCVGIDFETVSGRLKFRSWPGKFGEAKACLPLLRAWAEQRNIETVVSTTMTDD